MSDGILFDVYRLKHWESISLYRVAQNSQYTTSDMLNSECEETFATLYILRGQILLPATGRRPKTLIAEHLKANERGTSNPDVIRP